MLLTNKHGDSVESTLTNQEAVEKLPDNSWLWFYIHRDAMDQENAVLVKATNSFLQDTFLLAKLYGIKSPAVRVYYLTFRFKLYLSNRGTLCVKAGKTDIDDGTPDGSQHYVGCFTKDKFLPARFPLPSPVELSFIRQLTEDPTGFLAKLSRDMNRCCYCSQPLEDARSVTKGYGPVCARHWGLPWGDKGSTDAAPSFAAVYDDTAAGLCESIRAGDPFAKLVFGDWLEEHGLPRPVK